MKTGDEAWVDAFALDDLTVGEPVLLRHDDRRLAVVRTDDGIYTIDDRCPHEGYPLTQGTVEGCELTCCYHNFKFDLRTGACGRGEAVPTFETRVRGDRVEVRVPPPDPAAERAAAEKSLREGLFEQREGQMARDVVRLLRSGATPAEVVLEAARFDAERFPWGVTHVLPVAWDVLGLCERYPGVEAVRPLMQCLELAADGNVRRPVRETTPAIDPGPDRAAAEERYRAAVEAEEHATVEGLVRGALARGWGRLELEPWFFGPPCDHFLSFAHSAIYASKVFDLLDAGGWSSAPSLLVGLALQQVNATREDVLPAWGWWRKAMAAVRPDFEAWYATPDPGADAVDEGLVSALLGPDRQGAFDAVADALSAGRRRAVLDALSIAAAERVRRFDVKHDGDETVQDGWLDVTHAFTFAQAIRVAFARHRRPEVQALALQAARMIQNAGVLDRPDARPMAPIDGDLATLADAIAHQRADRAEALVRGWLASERPLGPLRGLLEDLPLQDAYVRPIVVAHVIKTTRAAFDELAVLPDPRIGAALARFAASPVRQRFLGSRVHEAIRFIVHGKVPRLLT